MGKLVVVVEMEALQEGLFSWTAVYLAVMFPALVMVFNFVFGNCFLGEALAHNQHATTGKGYYRSLGRLCVVVVLGLFIWQYYIYMFQTRKGRVDRCNPPVYIWHLVDGVFWGKEGASYALRWNCPLDEVCFLALWSLHLALYAACVMSVPQLGAKSDGGSFCRKCNAYVEDMDHHCFLIGNCVGSKNRKFFLCLLTLCVVNMFFLLLTRGAWAYAEGGVFILLGLLLVIGAAVVGSCLLILQCCLLRKNKTTLSFLKEERRSRRGILRALAELMR
ncbi:zinc-finger multi-pass transmembrane protein [Trypanosoma conorhini]|uniref:Palmitoyltransferase n=1 Tax=Trypanosoma conorhini TaxID=83891 RepID=A0A3R7NL55_9TRYP|nr:zinc-finger multi-pass transmembrane protein [Trypanosoma conorhini]RNF08104.1 zinc-finger multi-pass transmembrane protein [Trypanosoma conorhini]